MKLYNKHNTCRGRHLEYLAGPVCIMSGSARLQRIPLEYFRPFFPRISTPLQKIVTYPPAITMSAHFYYSIREFVVDQVEERILGMDHETD